MDVPEKFLVYQVIKAPLSGSPPIPKPTQWVDVTRSHYLAFKGEKRRLAILPLFHVHVRRWFSPANGWYCSLDIRDGTKQVLKTEPLSGGWEDSWVRKAIIYLHTKCLMALPEGENLTRCGTLYLRETLNIDYDVTEVKRKADL